jgi:hypothetical protein
VLIILLPIRTAIIIITPAIPLHAKISRSYPLASTSDHSQATRFSITNTYTRSTASMTLRCLRLATIHSVRQNSQLYLVLPICRIQLLIAVSVMAVEGPAQLQLWITLQVLHCVSKHCTL